MQEKRLHTFALYLALFFSGLVVSVGGLAHFAGLGFLIGALTPLLIVSALAWGLYALVRVFYNGDGQDAGALVSGLGPEGVILQRATQCAWGHDLQSEAGRHFVAGEVHFRAGRYLQAAEAFSESVKGRESLATNLNLGAALLNIADFKGAREALAMGVRQAQRQQDRGFEAAFQLNLGVLHARQGKLMEALVAYEEAQRHFELLADGRGLGDALTNIGQAQAHLGRLEAAFASGERALKVHQETGSALGRAGALSCLGYVSFRRGELAEALVYLSEALQIHESLGNALGQGHVLTHIGNLRFKEEDLEAALKAYEQACALHGKAGDSLGEASALVNLGNVQFKKGALDAALQHYDQALKLHERGGNVMGQARALTNIGSLMGRQGQLTAALDGLNRARGFYLEIGEDSGGLQMVDKLIARFERKIQEKENSP
ncbi:MAG TPA: tetratricopeptide repeat protein [Candidatus Latescibacteria bacterium]|nr:tetratricopeptide repeat protein [Candidatus Handelsmanbacteria bacterium]HIL11561.1 tetratricopeptide repeat protein [Candidatus Latescibacterota bacterium]